MRRIVSRAGRLSAGVLLLTACASAGGGSSSSPTIEEAYGALSAESAVSQFLDAARRNDYRVMSRLFGTVDGPAAERIEQAEIEQRMFVLASLLRHQSYAVRPTQLTEAEGKTRLIVDMVGTRNGNVSVPFIAASDDGRWFVEQIVTEALTSG